MVIDDSNATHPTSTICALAAVDRPLVLSGADSALDFPRMPNNRLSSRQFGTLTLASSNASHPI